MEMYEIEPTNGRKSFYGKAKVVEEGGEKKLFSYDTLVALVKKNGDVCLFPKWDFSNTTLSHVRAFLDFAGKPAGTKKQIAAMYEKK